MGAPTPKQVRFHYKRIRRRMWLLQEALNAAHHKNVIHYKGEYKDEAPCWAMDQVKARVEATTKEVRAQAFKDEIMEEIKDCY